MRPFRPHVSQFFKTWGPFDNNLNQNNTDIALTHLFLPKSYPAKN